MDSQLVVEKLLGGNDLLRRHPSSICCPDKNKKIKKDENAARSSYFEDKKNSLFFGTLFRFLLPMHIFSIGWREESYKEQR